MLQHTCLIMICAIKDCYAMLIPEQTAQSAIPGVSPGTNSARLFAPGKRKA